MANFFEELNEDMIDFISKQQMFFVATAPKEGRINLSPKGLSGLKIGSNNKLLWLNYFGSGNETAAHLLEDGRMTLMMCAYEGDPKILRIYAQVNVIQEKDEQWAEYIGEFDDTKGARQVFELNIESVNDSCGWGVPLYEYQGQRTKLTNYYGSSTKEEHMEYMQKNNQVSFDGKKTGLFD